ncbi:MAG TPA: hypothetical protein EYP25_02340 [Anaerolineae bacterium]|nr:hypothetical protein [Anaerolineae bacterium]
MTLLAFCGTERPERPSSRSALNRFVRPETRGDNDATKALPADTDEHGNADDADASQRRSAQIIFLIFSFICVYLRFINAICVLQIYLRNSISGKERMSY